MNWQPIKTAPKDGTEILLMGKLRKNKLAVSVGFWLAKYWMTNDGGDPEWSSIISFKPTHWMSLPALPEDVK